MRRRSGCLRSIRPSGRNVSAAETLGNRCFSHCEEMRNINLPNVTVLPEYTFEADAKLVSVSIPKVTRIGKYAFFYCDSLMSITIPNSVTSIGTHAFYGNISLSSIVIPKNVTSIGNQTFESCGSLTDVYYYGTEEEWNSVSIEDGNDALKNATIHFISILKGDADGDGIVGVKDILLIKQFLSLIVDLDEQSFINADVNGDGYVNMKDVLEIMRMIAE